MSEHVLFVERWRGEFLECAHYGQAVIVDGSGQIVNAWGNPHATVLPRSSCKMVQALPLIESGAAERYSLNSEHLALACSSHQGGRIHTDRVTAWLSGLGLGETDLRCGPQLPNDLPARNALIIAEKTPCQIHNNCSGKHSGFLTLNKHLGGSVDYIDPSHPVQKASLAALEETSGITSAGYGIDGCSAPNFATTLYGLARSMAFFANAVEGNNLRQTAAVRLRNAMMAHPELVAGETRACTEIMNEMAGRGIIKTGADGVFTAILPTLGFGLALKIQDGSTVASNCAIAAILSKLGVLEPDSVAAKNRMNTIVKSRRGLDAGIVKPSSEFA
ncbi:MAG: asparaginase [Paracoccaceae bacterium]|nr:asparaginase [Paracoccaceae bacterium]MDG1736420.1 asparaginase [Paracoccaceae bacterium]MDG2257735.1 asparaginase [Paracoccaceae bacterium]